MNCRNCGAAMELHAVRRYFFCTHCGSFHCPEPVDEGSVCSVTGRRGSRAPSARFHSRRRSSTTVLAARVARREDEDV